ncbi:hypothetical protein [Arthrobacter oryzae]|uniref:hypothetical protein n=1 Tax=Arthrobacter oryzae TaxID=409290 RepID=UPI00273C94CC|nr:hypothetical protein [Arthrobacter oryzae]WLQ07122.1 hypothetical protein Q8Z05_02925 [Arthrobacter oryzae]
MTNSLQNSFAGYSKVFAYYPRGERTGGPEALHQLISGLRKLGQEAYLVPLPGTEDKPRVAEYELYDAPESSRIDDLPRAAVVVPEVAYTMLSGVHNARKFCWWLSIDNSPIFRRERLRLEMKEYGLGTRLQLIENDLRKHASSIQRTLSGKRRLLRDVEHLVQSQYAWSYLYSRMDIVASMVSDFTPLNIICDNPALTSARGLTVVFNPKKSAELTRRVAVAYPRASFRPLVNMSRCEVMNALESSAVYLDLGSHPGKDRMPREAALVGCVSIVARRGSAAFSADVPLPWQNKVNLQTGDAVSNAISVLDKVFAFPDEFQRGQRGYVAAIKSEEQTFLDELAAVFLEDRLGSDTRCGMLREAAPPNGE